MRKKGLRQAPDKASGELQAANPPWGRWTVLNQGIGYKVKLIEVRPGHRLSLQFHHHRTEHWVVVSGRARVLVGEKVLDLAPLDSTVIPVGTLHRLENPWSHPLVMVEVQKGDLLSEEDIVRVEDDYARAQPPREAGD